MTSDHLPDVLSRPLFSLGRKVATPGAIDLLNRTETAPITLFHRHQHGDFGSVCANDIQANNEAISLGGRILSCYRLGAWEERVLLITEADRSANTILLPTKIR